MAEKIDAKVVTIRTKEGADILGYYCGESEKTDMFDATIILYRPIVIQPAMSMYKGVPIYTYTASLYFRYGSQVVHMPYSRIHHHDIASEFFTSFYFESIVDLLEHDARVAESHTQFYAQRAVRDVLKAAGTDSMLVECTTEFAQ